jgi:cephalosporin hydroxylase
MEHFYQNIFGHFDYSKLFTRMVEEHGDDTHFVEIGAFYGMSSAYMAVEIINSGKKIKYDIVDTWRGSPEHQEGEWDAQESMINDTAFDIFKNNMKPVEGHYTAHKMKSVDAAKLYEDNSLDFVFIDGSHEYEFVKEDIEAWYPKVKVGGYLGGHDYINHQMPSGAFGVIQAVNEAFSSDRIELIQGGNVNSWLVVK